MWSIQSEIRDIYLLFFPLNIQLLFVSVCFCFFFFFNKRNRSKLSCCTLGMIESNFQNGLNYVEIYVEMAKHKIVLYKNKLSTHCTYVQSVTLAIVVYIEQDVQLCFHNTMQFHHPTQCQLLFYRACNMPLDKPFFSHDIIIFSNYFLYYFSSIFLLILITLTKMTK